MISPLPTMSNEELALFNELLTQRFGLCFPEHKREILASRLYPRLRANHLQRFIDYYLMLQYDYACERDHLVRAVTNNESYFFREIAQLEALQETSLRDAGERRPIRLLSAGCAAGEEPFTMRIFDATRRFGGGFEAARIDAIDIDTERLAMAQEACYGAHALRGLDEPQIDRYFTPAGDDRWSLRDRYRRHVSFHRGNLVDVGSLPINVAYDAVFCRNVLIYFEETALRRAIESFARLVRPGGLLFLGHAESIIGLTEQFRAERFGSCIAYRRSAS